MNIPPLRCVVAVKHSFKAIGIEARFFDVTKPEQIAALADENTKCIYMETLANPSYNVPDFDVIAKVRPG